MRRLISATGQDATLDALLTGRENLEMFGALLGLGRAAKRRAEDLLLQVGLADAGNRTVATYSGGMRRRLDLAVSLLSRPAVLFLDEPPPGWTSPAGGGCGTTCAASPTRARPCS